MSKVPSWGTKLAPKKHLIQQSKTNLEPTTTHGSRLDRCLQPRRHHAPACIAFEKPLIPISTLRFSSNKQSKCRPIFGESQSAMPFPPQTRPSFCCRPDVVNSHASASTSMQHHPRWLVLLYTVWMLTSSVSSSPVYAVSTPSSSDTAPPAQFAVDRSQNRSDSASNRETIIAHANHQHVALLRSDGLHSFHRLHLPRRLVWHRQVWCRYRRHGCPPP